MVLQNVLSTSRCVLWAFSDLLIAFSDVTSGCLLSVERLCFTVNVSCGITSTRATKPLCVCYQETRWLGRHRQSETTAGNYRRHTRTMNVSPPTQASTAARATKSNPPTRPLFMHLSRTPHPVPPRHQAQRQYGTHRGRNRNLRRTHN